MILFVLLKDDYHLPIQLCEWLCVQRHFQIDSGQPTIKTNAARHPLVIVMIFNLKRFPLKFKQKTSIDGASIK
jgi:hypothetical protein